MYFWVNVPMYARQHQPSSHLRLQLEDAMRWCRRIFAAIKPQAYYERPIPLRQPVIFYYGHLPAFASNQIFGSKSEFDSIFARGIDPPENELPSDNRFDFPSIAEVDRYKDHVENEVLNLDFEDPTLREVLHITIEHYWMHAETLFYILHQLPHDLKNQIPYDRKPTVLIKDYGTEVTIPAGYATLGVCRDKIAFGWCNEFDEHKVWVPEFKIDKYKVTNSAFLEFIESGGYKRERLWDEDAWNWVESTKREHPQFWFKQDGRRMLRDLFEDIRLPLDWPVYVSHAEACAYARSVGAELPSEEEFHRAAYGTLHEQCAPQPWGHNLPLDGKGNFGFRSLSPAPVGAHPQGMSDFGVSELVGNGWEWTRTIFAPFSGFKALSTYPTYSADFFDRKHYVLKGASPVTADELVRRSFRNWFRPHYPYAYSGFRCIYR